MVTGSPKYDTMFHLLSHILFTGHALKAVDRCLDDLMTTKTVHFEKSYRFHISMYINGYGGPRDLLAKQVRSPFEYKKE